MAEQNIVNTIANNQYIYSVIIVLIKYKSLCSHVCRVTKIIVLLILLCT